MPYIPPKMREHIEEDIRTLADTIAPACETDEKIDGTLNYTICRLITLLYPDESYFNYNRIIGVLECVKQEIYRRRVGPYEDGKIKDNGDLPGWEP